MEWLLMLLVGVSAVSLVLTLLLQGTAHWKLRRKPLGPGPTPGISVLKPLRGLDDGLEANLRSLAEQDYPCFEILFAAEDPRDPALRVAWRIKRAYPAVPIRILVSDEPVLNPKVANLVAMTRVARHPYLLVSDSNVRARPDYLRAMAAETRDPRVGLVSSMLAGTGEATVGALLENAHLNSFIVAAVCAGNEVARHPCVIGKSMLMRRDDLERLGGWESVGDILAEDYVLGQRFHAAGMRVALSGHVLPTVNENWSVRRFLARHLRWNQMRRRVAPFAYVAEPLLYPVPWLFAVIVAVLAFPEDAIVSSRAIVLASALGIALKAVADHVLSRRLRGVGFDIVSLPWLVVKDVLTLGLWAIGAFRTTVTWRGHRMRIGAGTRPHHAPAEQGAWTRANPAG